MKMFILVVWFVFLSDGYNKPQYTAPTTVDVYHSYESCDEAGKAWAQQVNPNYAKFACVPSGATLKAR